MDKCALYEDKYLEYTRYIGGHLEFWYDKLRDQGLLTNGKQKVLA